MRTFFNTIAIIAAIVILIWIGWWAKGNFYKENSPEDQQIQIEKLIGIGYIKMGEPDESSPLGNVYYLRSKNGIRFKDKILVCLPTEYDDTSNAGQLVKVSFLKDLNLLGSKVENFIFHIQQAQAKKPMNEIPKEDPPKAAQEDWKSKIKAE